MPSFQRLSFSLMEVQMNWPTFLLGSHGVPGGGSFQERSMVFGYFNGVSLNHSGGVEPSCLMRAWTSALDFSAAVNAGEAMKRKIRRKSFTRSSESLVLSKPGRFW